MELGDQLFHCWKKEGHGGMNLHEGMKVSCDVYFYELAKRTGVDRLSAMARKLGFGQRLGVDLPGERGGLTPTVEWYTQRWARRWPQGETLNAGIGQGFVLTTPLQLATMTSRLVNGGVAVQPHLLRAIAGKPSVTNSYPSMGLNSQHLQAIVRAMAGVCNEENGTGYKLRITQPGMEMGGKSGTAQVRRITMQEREKGVRKNEDLPWRERDHALFVSYAPVSSPRYACAVIVEHGGSGSTVAAPICRDVLLEVQKRDPMRKSPQPGAGRVAAIDAKRL
jgi:penicillin-binding protein 2